MSAHKNPPTLGELAEQLGFDPKLARFMPVEVKVEPLDASITDALLANMAAQGIEEAAAPITESGKPRILKLTAWMAHGGPANRNGDAFLEEDLSELALGGLFAPPYLGMIDFNHDFNAYGAWYSARYEFDPKANQYGLLAEGALFAWRYTELADKLLAEQTRNGHINVSMACIARWIEPREGVEGRTESVLRKPVFLAVSVLDLPPADPYGNGLGAESEDSSSEDRLRELNKALLSIHAAGDTFEVWKVAFLNSETRKASQTQSQEETMDVNTIIAALTEALGSKAEGMLDEIKAAVADAAKVPGLEADNARLAQELADAVTRAAAAEASAETLSGELEAANTALQAKIDELTQATAAHAELQTAHDALVAEKEEAARTALVEARMAQLPETYRKALEAREEDSRNKVVARIAGMTDEEFAEEIEILKAGLPTASYTDRSSAEGFLGTGAQPASGGGYAIDQFSK